MQSHGVVAGAVPGTSRLAKVQTATSFPSTIDAGPSSLALRRQREPREESALSSRRRLARESRCLVTILPRSLHLAGFADNMALSYFFESYGWINMHSILLQDNTMRGGLDDKGLVYDCLRALCYGLLGRDQSIVSLQTAGRTMFARAIQSLRAQITTTSKAELAALVKPISLMGSYSIVVEQDLRFTHHTGLSHVLEFCGPESFQSASLLPVFESVRWALISDAIVRRERTFLERPEWKTVPWANNPAAKSATNLLLDQLASIPTIIEGIWGIMNDRVQWLLDGGPRIELPETIPRLQTLVRRLHDAGEQWRKDWEAAHPDIAPRVMAWALFYTTDDAYQPGIGGMQGPDAFDMFVLDGVKPSRRSSEATKAFDSWMKEKEQEDPEIQTLVAVHVQDVALYATMLVWITRLNKYLVNAARSPTCIDFFTAPFHSSCTCCDTAPRQRCETVPPADVAAKTNPAMAWNTATCAVAVAPMRVRTGAGGSPEGPTSDKLDSAVLVPNDVRFAGQLRILSWLCRRLPATRSQVLGTLAAVGLAHCAHDVRPADGIAEVASVAVAHVFDSAGFDGATDVLLRSYHRMPV